ncbi:type II toxin-antitoxin system ParD family antitoxin [Labrenzia sp. ac12]|uniref:type II toxin-antitoxin system ParD family antitoxin n=1 Tax=Labrenzia sp. THAF35 TaxID=2587854 RepID=UPI0012683C19|nr:type II toxin-antitoxin system ParD family antitoxin [Labrenzia sp. THAF35]QFT68624.1 Antitoxin ParD4 [Labrenzia sp. THAF35]
MNFSLGKKLEEYVAEQIASGPYNNASEVVRDALRLHEEHYLKLEVLRRDVQQGVQSVKSGRVSRASADEVIAKAKQRKQA